MLKVLHVIDTLHLGGTEVQCVSLIRHLDPSRYESQCVCFKGGGDLLEGLRESGVFVEVVAFPGFRSLGAVKALLALVGLTRRRGIHIVQSYGFYSNLPAMLAGRLAGVRVLIASRRDMGEFLSPRDQRVERVGFRLADRIVVNAEAIGEQLIDGGQARREKIRVIPTGVDVGQFSPAASSRPVDGPASDGGVVAMVAKFRRQKDQPTFLRAAQRVLAVQPAVRFTLAGDGYLRPPAERLAVELGISPTVRLLGDVARREMPQFLRGVSVAVLASNGNEGIPNAILEAMAAGKPVVATDTGGCREAVVDGVTGFLVPVRDAERLAEKILWLLEHEAEAARMGKAGRERIDAEFSTSRMMERFSTLYQELALEKLGAASLSAA